MAEKLRRRKKEEETAKVGRPTLEDQTFLTDEMEEFCQLIRAGFTIEESSNELGIGLEKATKFSDNKLVQQRIRNLLGDKLPRWLLKQDELYEAVVNRLVKDVRSGDIAHSLLYKIFMRLDPFRVDKETVKTISQEERMLMESADGQASLPLPNIDSSQLKEQPRSMFRKMTITQAEKGVESKGE